jgi:hypothetical protein
VRLCAVRREINKDASEPQSVFAQFVAHDVFARACGIAFVEDEVDHCEHCSEMRRELPAARNGDGIFASASVRFARTMRCAIVGSGTKNARAIASVVRPPARRSEGDLRFEGEQWMASRKNEPQNIVAGNTAGLVVECFVPFVFDVSTVRVGIAGKRFVFSRRHLLPTNCIHAAILRARHEPRARIFRHAVPRPLFERGDKRILRELFGEPRVPHYAREAGDQLRRFEPENCLNRALGIGNNHVPPIPYLLRSSSRKTSARRRAALFVNLEDFAVTVARRS